MVKLSLAVLCALILSIGTAKCADPTLMKPGALYRVWFSPDYINAHPSMGDNANQYVIQIDAVNNTNSNWVQIEFPQAANQSFNSSLSGKRWINLNFVVELRTYTPPPGQ